MNKKLVGPADQLSTRVKSLLELLEPGHILLETSSLSHPHPGGRGGYFPRPGTMQPDRQTTSVHCFSACSHMSWKRIRIKWEEDIVSQAPLHWFPYLSQYRRDLRQLAMKFHRLLQGCV